MASTGGHLTGLQLRHFRSYRDYAVEINDGVNIVVGPNASGKTNLLESMYCIMQGSSFRGRDVDLISFGEEWLRVDAYGSDVERTLKIKRIPQGGSEKAFSLDGLERKRLSRQYSLPVVLFEPNHLRLIHGSPELRRGYLDDICVQQDPEAYVARSNYRRALLQRNKLLKQLRGGGSRDQLFVWDIKLCEEGARMHEKRRQLISRINERATDLYSAISGRVMGIELCYVSSVSADDYQSHFLKMLTDTAERDIERGFTGAGPHRDDFCVYMNDADASVVASRGEVRTIVLMLKIAEMSLLDSTRRPLVLLDDVFSELDAGRRHALTSHLRDHQTIITTTDADAIVGHFVDGYKIITTATE